MLLNIHKPPGPTSHDIVDKVRKITGERRVGHGGTLDPFAEGVLIIGVSRESTKKLGGISKNTEKEYLATMELGKTSTTGDIEGDIVDYRSTIAPAQGVSGASPGSYPSQEPLSRSTITSVLESFTGEIEQTPPQYSAIKIKGKPAYKYAREGKEVKIPKRKVKIHEIELVDFAPPFLTVRVVCSSGTYIRTLAEDIGKELGVGAYLTKLVRTRVGEYRLEDSQTLQSFREQFSK